METIFVLFVAIHLATTIRGVMMERLRYDICPCCGVEWGNEDYTTESQAEYRKQWLESGTKWFEPQKKSDNWSLEKQLRNIGYNKGQCIGNDYFNNFLSPLSLFPNTLIW